MKVGYARYISDSQVKAMENADVDEMVFGVTTQVNEQKRFKDLIERLDTEDILVIESLNTLGEDITDIIENLTLLENKNISIHILGIDSEYNLSKLYDLETQKLIKNYMIHGLKQVEDLLKNDIRKRQTKGTQYMKELSAKKRSKGRPKKYSEDAEDPYDRQLYYTVIEKLKNNVAISDISLELDMSRTTIYRIKEEMEKDDVVD